MFPPDGFWPNIEEFGVASAEHVRNVVTKITDTSELLNRGVLLAPF